MYPSSAHPVQTSLGSPTSARFGQYSGGLPVASPATSPPPRPLTTPAASGHAWRTRSEATPPSHGLAPAAHAHSLARGPLYDRILEVRVCTLLAVGISLFELTRIFRLRRAHRTETTWSSCRGSRQRAPQAASGRSARRRGLGRETRRGLVGALPSGLRRLVAMLLLVPPRGSRPHFSLSPRVAGLVAPRRHV